MKTFILFAIIAVIGASPLVAEDSKSTPRKPAADTDGYQNLSLPLNDFQLRFIQPGDVVDLLITGRETGRLSHNTDSLTASYGQIVTVVGVSTIPKSEITLDVTSGGGLIPDMITKAIDKGDKARVLLRGAGDRDHVTIIGPAQSQASRVLSS